MPPGDERTHRAVLQLRAVLHELEGRLGDPPHPILRPDVVDSLVGAIQDLARRVAQSEVETAGRYAELGVALAQLAERLDAQAAHQAEHAARAAGQEVRVAARLDQAMEELARARSAPEPWPIRTVLAVAGAAAALSVMGAATLAIEQDRRPGSPAGLLSARPADLPLRPSLKARPSRPTAVVPAAAAAAATAAPVRLPASGDRADVYDDVARDLERGEATAMARLTGLAQAGDGRAQLHLASLYEAGDAGLPRDLPAARAWTQRAAEAGERVAMHNLAMFLMQGQGGPQDFAEAAAWFRRAADRGVVDSQYNLALLYEAGRGVAPNLREAYRWYSVAANAGDLASREKAVALEAKLKPGERAGLDRDVAGFQPGASTGEGLAVVIPPATTLAETQALLARQGYYVGPVDGIFTPEVRAAAQAYLRDHPGAGASGAGAPAS